MLGISDDTEQKRNSGRKRKRRGVSFNEDEEIINPEDVDPSVGKFRNLVQSTVVPTAKKQKLAESMGIGTNEFRVPRHIQTAIPQLYEDMPPETNSVGTGAVNMFSSLSTKLGMVLPNPAPEVNIDSSYAQQPPPFVPAQAQGNDSQEPKKKKYAKEAWPGKKPTQSLLV